MKTDSTQNQRDKKETKVFHSKGYVIWENHSYSRLNASSSFVKSSMSSLLNTIERFREKLL